MAEGTGKSLAVVGTAATQVAQQYLPVDGVLASTRFPGLMTMGVLAGAHTMERAEGYGPSVAARAFQYANAIAPPRFDQTFPSDTEMLGDRFQTNQRSPWKGLRDTFERVLHSWEGQSGEEIEEIEWDSFEEHAGLPPTTDPVVYGPRTVDTRTVDDVFPSARPGTYTKPTWNAYWKKTPRARKGLGGMDIFDSDAPRAGADPVTVEVQDLDPAPGEAPRPTSRATVYGPQPRPSVMRPTPKPFEPDRRFSVSKEQMEWYHRQPDTADSAPQSTPTVRAQARRDKGTYTHVDERIGYRPMEGTQGVVADPALGFNWTAAPPRDVFATLADQPRTREPDDFDWNRESVRFPVETGRYARENDNIGVREFQYGDPPGPPGGSHTQIKWDCIGLAAMAATGTL